VGADHRGRFAGRETTGIAGDAAGARETRGFSGGTGAMSNRINLQSTLEPKLSQLWDLAQKDFQHAMDTSSNPPADKGQEMTRLRNDLSEILARFRTYYTLDQYDLDALADDIRTQGDSWETAGTPGTTSAYSDIVSAYAEVDDVAKLIHSEQWKGSAAQAFHDAFLLPYLERGPSGNGVGKIHAAATVEARAALLAFAEAVEGIKEKLVWICDKALGYVGGGPKAGGGGVDDGLNIVGFVAGAISLGEAIAVPELVVADVALNLLGVILGLKSLNDGGPYPSDGWLIDYSAAEDLPHVDWKFSGAYRVIGDAGVNLRHLAEESIPDVDDALYGVLRDGFIKGMLHDYGTIGKQDLTGAYDATTVKNGAGPGNVDPVVANYVRLYYAGSVSLPTAASYYDAAQKYVGMANVDSLAAQLPRSVAKFTSEADAFAGLLSGFRNDFYTYGQAMVAAAQNYQNVDAQEADAIRKLEADIPSYDGSTGSEYSSQAYTPPPWLRE
jgi:hypothetical protein